MRNAAFCRRTHVQNARNRLIEAFSSCVSRPNNATQPVSIISVHDLWDGVNPYEGQGASYWQESVVETLEVRVLARE